MVRRGVVARGIRTTGHDNALSSAQLMTMVLTNILRSSTCLYRVALPSAKKSTHLLLQLVEHIQGKFFEYGSAQKYFANSQKDILDSLKPDYFTPRDLRRTSACFKSVGAVETTRHLDSYQLTKRELASLLHRLPAILQKRRPFWYIVDQPVSRAILPQRFIENLSHKPRQKCIKELAFEADFIILNPHCNAFRSSHCALLWRYDMGTVICCDLVPCDRGTHL